MAAGLPLVVWSALVVPVPAVLLSLVVDGPGAVVRLVADPPPSAVLATAYTVYGASVFGYVVRNRLLGRYPAGAVAPYVLLVPPVGLAAAWAFQGERLSPLEAVGGVLLLGGVAGAAWRPRSGVPGPGRAGPAVAQRAGGAR